MENLKGIAANDTIRLRSVKHVYQYMSDGMHSLIWSALSTCQFTHISCIIYFNFVDQQLYILPVSLLTTLSNYFLILAMCTVTINLVAFVDLSTFLTSSLILQISCQVCQLVDLFYLKFIIIPFIYLHNSIYLCDLYIY